MRRWIVCQLSERIWPFSRICLKGKVDARQEPYPVKANAGAMPAWGMDCTKDDCARAGYGDGCRQYKGEISTEKLPTLTNRKMDGPAAPASLPSL